MTVKGYGLGKGKRPYSFIRGRAVEQRRRERPTGWSYEDGSLAPPPAHFHQRHPKGKQSPAFRSTEAAGAAEVLKTGLWVWVASLMLSDIIHTGHSDRNYSNLSTFIVYPISSPTSVIVP